MSYIFEKYLKKVHIGITFFPDRSFICQVCKLFGRKARLNYGVQQLLVKSTLVIFSKILFAFFFFRILALRHLHEMHSN